MEVGGTNAVCEFNNCGCLPSSPPFSWPYQHLMSSQQWMTHIILDLITILVFGWTKQNIMVEWRKYLFFFSINILESVLFMLCMFKTIIKLFLNNRYWEDSLNFLSDFLEESNFDWSMRSYYLLLNNLLLWFLKYACVIIIINQY